MSKSRVQQIDLEERVGQTQAKQNTSISILDPAIYISRSHKDWDDQTSEKKSDDEEENSEPEWDYLHFRASFTLEVEILGFEKAPQQYNKFFDSISIRYLYKEKEHHLWYPERDEPVDVDISNETTTTTGAGLGVGMAGTIPIPAPEVHVQKDRKLTVARKMRSWRKGVSMEKFRGLGDPSAYPVHVVSDGVTPKEHPCPKDSGEYKESVHWDYQVESKQHSWVPEIYESVAIPITVERIVPVPSDAKIPFTDDECELLMHFDFQINTRLRGMSPTFPFFTDFSKPAEYRYDSDTGQRFPLDRYSVCLFGYCPGTCLPEGPTIDLDEATKAFYKAAKEKQHHNPFFLPSDKVLEEDFLYPAKMETFTKRRKLADQRRRMRAARLDRERKEVEERERDRLRAVEAEEWERERARAKRKKKKVYRGRTEYSEYPPPPPPSPSPAARDAGPAESDDYVLLPLRPGSQEYPLPPSPPQPPPPPPRPHAESDDSDDYIIPPERLKAAGEAATAAAKERLEAHLQHLPYHYERWRSYERHRGHDGAMSESEEEPRPDTIKPTPRPPPPPEARRRPCRPPLHQPEPPGRPDQLPNLIEVEPARVTRMQRKETKTTVTRRKMTRTKTGIGNGKGKGTANEEGEEEGQRTHSPSPASSSRAYMARLAFWLVT
ncbi:hypothetical protein Z517_07255 [Fonsecaea pedrosoi CBS 271.37]|uniref:Uncharacterized protein n=1 Tax=Fonsecaea pedrosoi CBS 271.37 TaxID=1442368 RepID=A0A0D2H7L6_9EURO|nr:uncharacterized protein Z517_07255 [Fonsecaea pedrosoi CBS 271.37]KIW80639.1 hypothetical protein Z517_07255 [Fonsecaea pedrosoi CBS 271.37]